MEKLFSWANVHKGCFTSGLGVLIILASVVSVFSHQRSWTEAGAGIAVGITLLGMPDPKVGGGTGVVGGLGLILLLASGGCVSEKKLLAKYGTQNPPVTVAISDTLKLPVSITTKPDSLSTSFWLDSLADAPNGDTVRLVSMGGQATLKVWKSPVTKVGGGQRLHARVDVPTRVVHDTITKVVTLYAKCPPTYTIAPGPTRWQRIWHGYQDFCTALVSIVLIVALILLAFRKGLLRFLPFLAVLVVASAGCRSQKAPPYRFNPRQPSYLPIPKPGPLKY